MKTRLLLSLTLFIAVHAPAQGTVNFSTLGKMIRTAPNHTSLGHSDAGDLVPVPTTGYLAALYYAPVGVTNPNEFMQVGATAGFLAPGIIIAGTRTPPVTPPGAPANFQIRVWELSTGSDWSSANHRGESAIVNVTTANPNSFPVEVPASLDAIPGFDMYVIVIPEPSTLALGALGLGTFLLLRRRR